jgi:Flp pilus assembly protein TadD
MAAGVVCLLAATYFALERRDAERLRDANIAGAHGRFSQAVDASRAVKRAPAQARALLVEARAQRALGHRAAARRAFEQAARRDPNNWEIHRDWAILLSGLGDRAGAGRQMSRALSLNPRMTLPAGFVRARRR